MAGSGARRVVVIGAGIVGACTALALVEAGHSVTLVDPAVPGGDQSASFGNGGFISRASIIPMSVPGLWRKVPGYLMDPAGPLTIRPRDLPGLAPWLVRFLRAGSSWAKVRRSAAVLNAFVHDAPDRHVSLSRACGCGELIRQDGLIYAYASRADFEAEGFAWDIRAANGVTWRELEQDALWNLEPSLAPGHVFAAVIEDSAYCVDPGTYTRTLVECAVQRGARIVRAQATGFRMEGQRLRAVESEAGPICAEAAVVCAGIGSVGLARAVGDAVPMISERGYHVELPGCLGGPSRPVMPGSGKMANTPMQNGLRAAGQVELARTDAAPDWRRADILLENLRQTYHGLAFDETLARRWYGHRPSTPDSLPLIGASSHTPDVIHAFGHGHTGLAGAPITGAIVAALLDGAAPPVDVSPFSAKRFRAGM